jgi:autotransporter-associated beta strand protein
VLQVEGGIFTAADTTSGVVIAPNGGSSNQAGAGELYLSGGTSTVGRIAFGAGTDTVGGLGFLILGKTIETPTLYVGAGGIVKASSIGAYSYTIGLNSGTLGAAADWSSALNMTLGANPTIKAADSTDTARNIILSGNLSGTGFTKTGAGTLTLHGPNSYTGNTNVSAGILSLGNGTANSALADTADLVVGASAVVNLNFLAANSDTVSKLIIGGIEKATGTWGAPGSGATHIDGVHFSGPGTINVTTPPTVGFSAWIDDFGLALADQDPADDPDHDGMENLLEFVLNGNPSISDPSIQPVLNVTATNFEFTYNRRDDSVSPETTQTFQYGIDLTNWTSIIIPPAGGSVGAASIAVTDGTPTDVVKISIPKATVAPETKLFGRLQIIK